MTKEDRRPGRPSSHAHVVGFVGGYLVEQGTLTLDQLDAALLYQLHLAESGENATLAEVLLRLRMASNEDIARAEQAHQRDLARKPK